MDASRRARKSPRPSHLVFHSIDTSRRARKSPHPSHLVFHPLLLWLPQATVSSVRHSSGLLSVLLLLVDCYCSSLPTGDTRGHVHGPKRTMRCDLLFCCCRPTVFGSNNLRMRRLRFRQLFRSGNEPLHACQQ